MNGVQRRGIILLLGVLLGGIFGVFPCAGEDKVILNADEVVYDEAGYTALARGNVELRYGGLRLYGDRVEVDTRTNILNAWASEKEPVTMLWKGRRLYGEHVEYDLEAQEGTVYKASGQVGEIRLSGRDLQVTSGKKAKEKGWLSSRKMKGVDEEEPVARWDEVSLTTCREPVPHYRLVSRRVIVVPGKKVVAKNPRVYIGGTLLFQYPFDYVVKLSSRGKKMLQASFFPSLAYKSEKGMGIGLQGPLSWNQGEIDLGLMYWDKIGMEGSAELTHQLSPQLSLYALSEYSWDDISEETNWRAQWGLIYRQTKWKASLMWSQREYVEIEKRVGETYRGTLWRDPEFFVYSPWFTDNPSGGWWRLIGTAGSYEEDNLEVDRKGAGVELYGHGKEGKAFVPFWKALYMYYAYDGEGAAAALLEEEDTQEVTEATFGVTWGLGSLRMRTSYVRRWVSGKSPMNWDQYDEREDIYQKISIPLDKGWGIALRGGYDNLEGELGEMVYWVTYETDCMAWELVYRDDLGDDDDNWAGLRISILAFPDTPFGIGQEKVEIPGEPPKDLPVSPQPWQ